MLERDETSTSWSCGPTTASGRDAPHSRQDFTHSPVDHNRIHRCSYRLRTLLIAMLVFNIIGGLIWLQCEAIAVTRASNEHGHITDADERIRKMNEHMDDFAWNRKHFYSLAFTWAGINIALGSLVLAKIRTTVR